MLYERILLYSFYEKDNEEIETFLLKMEQKNEIKNKVKEVLHKNKNWLIKIILNKYLNRITKLIMKSGIYEYKNYNNKEMKIYIKAIIENSKTKTLDKDFFKILERAIREKGSSLNTNSSEYKNNHDTQMVLKYTRDMVMVEE